MTSRALQATLVSTATALLLLTVVMNYLSTSELGTKLGLFSNNSGVPWNQRGHLIDSSLTPPGYAFAIWGIIYAYQAAMLIYCWSLLFRRSRSSGEPLCCEAGLLPAGFLICHSASSCLNVAWVLLADRVDADKPLLVPQTIAIFGLTVAMICSLAFSLKSLADNRRQLQQRGLATEYWLSVALLQNACGLYAGWVAIASFLNLDIAVINLADFAVSSSGLLCLCQISACLAAYCVADLLLFDTCTRFLITPYFSLIWAIATSVANNYQPQSPTSVVSVELLLLLLIVLLLKVTLAVVRQRRRPLPVDFNDASLLGGEFHFSRLQLT